MPKFSLNNIILIVFIKWRKSFTIIENQKRFNVNDLLISKTGNRAFMTAAAENIGRARISSELPELCIRTKLNYFSVVLA